MTLPLDKALKGTEEALTGDANVLKVDSRPNTLHCDKKALKGNNNTIKCIG